MSVSSLGIPCPVVCGLPLGGGSILKGASDKVAASVMSTFSSWVVQGATWLIVHALAIVVPETSPNLSARWFAPREGSMLQIAALLVGPLLGAATIGAVLRQDGRRLVRIWFVGLPVGVLCASTAVALTNLALNVVNALCKLVTPPHGYQSIQRLGPALTEHGAPAFVQFIIASLMVLAGLVLWLELVLRSAVLYIAVFFLPLGLAAFIWPATAHMTKRFVELIVAVIGSKFVIVATLTLGSATVGGHATIDGVITGTAILLLAAFAPYSLLRLIPLVEAAAIGHLEGSTGRSGRAAAGAAGHATSSGRRLAGSVAGLVAGPQGGLATTGVGAADIGERAGEWTPPTPSADPPGQGSGTGARGGPSSDPGPSSAGSSGAGSAGAGSDSAGSSGAGSAGAGSHSTGSTGTGSTGTGSSGAGSSGAGSAGAGSAGAGSAGAGSAGAGSSAAGGSGTGGSGGVQGPPIGAGVPAIAGRGGSAGGTLGDAPPGTASGRPWSSSAVTPQPSTGHDTATDPPAGRAPVVAALPRVRPGSAGPDLDGWSDE